MGKSLKGRELGVGISQRKDGLYTGRFTSKQTGKPIQKYFKSLQECRNWYADAILFDRQGDVYSDNMIVDALFQKYVEFSKEKWSIGTLEANKYRYDKYVSEKFKKKPIKEVKALHCQEVLNAMTSKYSWCTIENVRILLSGMFTFAVDNELLVKSPVNKKVRIPGKPKVKEAMTVEEQSKFLETAKEFKHYNELCFVLQTGLRIGELMGLQWEDIDFENRELHVQRQLTYRNRQWRYSSPKSECGNRMIPLTSEAIRILKDQKRIRKVVSVDYPNLVFASSTGKPITCSGIDRLISNICDKAGIKHFSVHQLRHTMCTRAFEAGASPRVMQEIMGHSDIDMTMKIYTHVQDEFKHKEVEKLENGLKIV